MASVQLNPYINFDDKSEEALQFYQSVLGGEVTISRFSDFASPEMPVAEEHQSLVMHGALISDTLQLFIADAKPIGGTNVGDNISISLSGDDSDAVTLVPRCPAF